MRRQDIFDAIKARLEQVDGIKKVYEWAAASLNKEELPAIVVRDVSSRGDNSPSGSTVHFLSVEIDILVSDSDTTMPTLRSLMEKTLEALEEKDDESDIVCYREYVEDEILTSHEGYFYGGARLKTQFKYATQKWRM
jgi:hypothetical protein